MKKRILINEQNFRLLFESDDDFVANIYRLANIDDIENIELSIQLGIGQGVDIEQFLKEKYAKIIDFLWQYGYDVQLSDEKTFIQQIDFILNLENLNLGGKGLSRIPEYIDKLVNLKVLNLFDNKLSDLPNTIINLTQLNELLLLVNNFSKDTILRIRKNLPNVKIHADS